jgi:hypothetical protein
MHLEPLEKLPRTVREFLSHYAMIVLSILTALALEQVAVRIEHRHEGQRAKDEIEQEIASNRKAVEASLALTRTNSTAWDALLKRTLDDMKSGQGTDESRVATLRQAAGLFRDALPSLKTTAWDAAISDHSVNYLDHDLLTRYSEIYASQRLFMQAMWDTVRDTGIRNLSGITQAIYLGKADEAATVTTLNERMLVIHILESQLVQLDDTLKDEAAAAALPALPASVASPAAASH